MSCSQAHQVLIQVTLFTGRYKPFDTHLDFRFMIKLQQNHIQPRKSHVQEMTRISSNIAAHYPIDLLLLFFSVHVVKHVTAENVTTIREQSFLVNISAMNYIIIGQLLIKRMKEPWKSYKESF